MPLSLCRIIHHSHSSTRLKIYHHNYFKYKTGTYSVDRGEGEYTLNSDGILASKIILKIAFFKQTAVFVEQVGMKIKTIFCKRHLCDY